MRFLRSFIAACVGSSLLAGAASAQASVRSTVNTLPAVSAAVAGSIAVSIDAGAIQTLGNITDNIANNFPSPVTITLAWDLHPSTGAVQVIGYFADPAAAMTSGPVSIPSSWFKGRVMSTDAPGAPTAFTAFTQNGSGGIGAPGASLSLLTQPVLGYSKAGVRTIDLELQLDLVGRSVSVGAYSGTLNIRAVTQ